MKTEEEEDGKDEVLLGKDADRIEKESGGDRRTARLAREPAMEEKQRQNAEGARQQVRDEARVLDPVERPGEGKEERRRREDRERARVPPDQAGEEQEDESGIDDRQEIRSEAVRAGARRGQEADRVRRDGSRGESGDRVDRFAQVRVVVVVDRMELESVLRDQEKIDGAVGERQGEPGDEEKPPPHGALEEIARPVENAFVSIASPDSTGRE